MLELGVIAEELTGGAKVAGVLAKASPIYCDLADDPPCVPIHDAEDPAAPLAGMVARYAELYGLGRTVELHVFAGEDHAFDRRATREGTVDVAAPSPTCRPDRCSAHRPLLLEVPVVLELGVLVDEPSADARVAGLLEKASPIRYDLADYPPCLPVHDAEDAAVVPADEGHAFGRRDATREGMVDVAAPSPTCRPDRCSAHRPLLLEVPVVLEPGVLVDEPSADARVAGLLEKASPIRYDLADYPPCLPVHDAEDAAVVPADEGHAFGRHDATREGMVDVAAPSPTCRPDRCSAHRPLLLEVPVVLEPGVLADEPSTDARVAGLLEKASPIRYDLADYPPCLPVHDAEDAAVVLADEGHAFGRRDATREGMVDVAAPSPTYRPDRGSAHRLLLLEVPVVLELGVLADEPSADVGVAGLLETASPIRYDLADYPPCLPVHDAEDAAVVLAGEGHAFGRRDATWEGMVDVAAPSSIDRPARCLAHRPVIFRSTSVA